MASNSAEKAPTAIPEIAVRETTFITDFPTVWLSAGIAPNSRTKGRAKAALCSFSYIYYHYNELYSGEQLLQALSSDL